MLRSSRGEASAANIISENPTPWSQSTCTNSTRMYGTARQTADGSETTFLRSLGVVDISQLCPGVKFVDMTQKAVEQTP